MSRKRNEILPGAGVWDAFFDNQVQEVLEQSRSILPLPKSVTGQARLEFMAWPILAFGSADGLAQDLKVSRHEDFLWAYEEDPQFVAALLKTVTDYHTLPERAKSLSRRLADISNGCFSGGGIVQTDNESEQQLVISHGGLYDWKTITEILGCKNTPSQLKTEFHREKRKRRRIEVKWMPHFRAWYRLQEIRSEKKESILPLRAVTLRSDPEEQRIA